MNPVVGWAIAIGLYFLAALYLTPQMAKRENAPIQYGAAHQLSTITAAAKNYMTVNSSTLDSDAAAAGGTVPVTMATLVAAGFLDPTWQDIDPFGQTHILAVHRLSAGVLQGLVASCGGDTIPDITLRDLALHGPAEAGYISSETPTHATSISGQWAYQLNQFTVPGCSYAAGHLAAGIFLVGNQLVAPYLCRYAVAGHPEACTMYTDADFNNNNLNNAKDVTLITGQKLSEAGIPLGVAFDGSLVTKPSCPNNGAPQLYLAQQILGSNGTGYAMSGGGATYTDVGAAWQVTIMFQTELGQFHALPAFGAFTATAKCP